MTRSISGPVPSRVVVRNLFRGPVGIGIVAVGDAGPFAAGRAAAAAAMEDLGATPVDVPRGPDGEPVWPSGVAGSIAHTNDVAIAVTASTDRLESLGIDAEAEGRPINTGTARRICTSEELPRFTEPEALLVLFCAKEATYKALAPLGATRLGFQEVAYTFAGTGVLEGRIVNDAVDDRVPRTFTARYATANGFIVAGVQIDRRS